MIYIQSTRNGLTVYSAYTGMEESTIRALMEEIGHTNIQVMTEEDYIAATNLE